MSAYCADFAYSCIGTLNSFFDVAQSSRHRQKHLPFSFFQRTGNIGQKLESHLALLLSFITAQSWLFFCD